VPVLTSSPLLLIDGDQFLFKATAAVEEEVRWDEQNHVLYSNVEKAWKNLQSMVQRIQERFDTAQHAVCFSTYPGFRSKIDATYKATRAARKPLCYAALRERMDSTYTCVTFPALEADDVMGILATKPSPSGLRRIIVSQDKDMKTIPGELWDGKDHHHISEAEADRWHLYQTLTGDTVDEYKGCPGMGPVKANKLLDSTTVWLDDKTANEYPVWTLIVAAFEKQGLTEVDALVQARLARILRWSDWNATTKEPILWCPPA
jgi:DNA polymerase-1